MIYLLLEIIIMADAIWLYSFCIYIYIYCFVPTVSKSSVIPELNLFFFY